MKVVAITGSPRAGGNTDYLVDLALKEMDACGIETRKVPLCQYQVNPCQGHDECRQFATCAQQDAAPWILDEFVKADGVILASPVYYFNMTAQMKAFVDRNYFNYRHKIRIRAKGAGLIAICGNEGADETLRALQRFLRITGDIPADNVIELSGRAGKAGAAKDVPLLIEGARDLGKRLAEILTA